jgi:cell division protein FtsQ
MKTAGTKTVNRKSSKGATRKSSVAAAKKPKSFAWVNRCLIVLAVVAVAIVSTKGYMALNAIPVEHIIVSGKLQHTSPAALEDMVRPALVGGFLNADLERVREQLQSLPWVHEVSVRRRWPNALELHVVEQLPIARWGSDGFLNHEGSVFQSIGDGQAWSDLPLLQGPRGTTTVLMRIYQQVVEILAPHELLVEELSIDGRGQVEAKLRGGTLVSMGDEKYIEERLRRFVSVYQTELAVQESAIASVDLRYPNGMAVGFVETPHVAGL